jgi:hypothetical protein
LWCVAALAIALAFDLTVRDQGVDD